MRASVPLEHPGAHGHTEPAPVGGRVVTPVTVALAGVVVAMVAVLALRFTQGLGAVTNLNNGYPWGLWIAWDVVIGSALASGGFATALLVFVLNRGEYHPLVRPALLAALLGYLQAGFSVLADLGRWWDFWHIFWPGYAQVNSVLFEVAVCIMAYTVILAIEVLPVALERFGLQGLKKKLERMLFVFVGIGVLLPTMHQSSLGSLLIVFGTQIHPLYQSGWALPLLFLTSTLGMGLAAVTIEAAISSRGLKRPFEKEILGRLLHIGRGLMVAWLVLRLADITWRGAWSYAIEASLPALTFWLELALFSVPVWLLVGRRARRAQPIFLSAMAMALGGIVYRLAAFLVAYQTGAGWHYFPSLGELTVTAGLIAFEALVIIVAVRTLPILPAAEAPATRSSP